MHINRIPGHFCKFIRLSAKKEAVVPDEMTAVFCSDERWFQSGRPLLFSRLAFVIEKNPAMHPESHTCFRFITQVRLFSRHAGTTGFMYKPRINRSIHSLRVDFSIKTAGVQVICYLRRIYREHIVSIFPVTPYFRPYRRTTGRRKYQFDILTSGRWVAGELFRYTRRGCFKS